MKQFYKLVRADAEALRFYAECEHCGKRIYGAKIPLLCRSARSLIRCEAGKAGRMSQSAYNHTKADTTLCLTVQFNQCRRCYRWVCDDCFDSTSPDGACRKCFRHEEARACGLKEGEDAYA